MRTEKEDIDALVDMFNMAMTDDQAIDARKKLLQSLSDEGGMRFFMEPEVKKIRMWRREKMLDIVHGEMVQEAQLCLEMVEAGILPEYRKLFKILDHYSDLQEWKA